jgi:WASH complex subunit 7
LEIQELQSDGNVHLKDFFLVVPALMINAIEAMLQAKDKLFKRSRTSADSLFTDDGFVLGIAYLLKVGYSLLPIHQILVFK